MPADVPAHIDRFNRIMVTLRPWFQTLAAPDTHGLLSEEKKAGEQRAHDAGSFFTDDDKLDRRITNCAGPVSIPGLASA